MANKTRSQPMWKCDDCGGPAVWTFIEGVVHYHCERLCDGFMQLELEWEPMPEVGVEGSTRGGDTLDAGRPTSTKDQVTGCGDLPF